MPPKRQQPTWISFLITGNEGCGKTCLVKRFMNDDFNAEYQPTRFMDSFRKTVNIDGSDVKVDVADTDGQKNYEGYSVNYYAEKHVIIIVFDVSDQKSLSCIKGICGTIEQRTRFGERPVVAIVAGKTDLKSELNLVDVKNFAEHNDMLYYETCAKTGKNVNEMFTALTQKVYNKQNNKDGNGGTEQNHSTEVKQTSEENNSCACSIC